MNALNRVIRASALLACVIAVVGEASASGSARKTLPPGAKVVATVAIPPGTGGIAVGEGAVWTLSWGVSRLTRIDPEGNAVAGRITVKPANACPTPPSPCGEVAAGNGAVWVSLLTDNAVARVDPKAGRVVATIPVGPKPEGIAVSPGAVWVANGGGPSVSRIDPATNKVVATIRVGPASACCSDHNALTWGGGAIWVTVPKLGAVVRIDPATNQVAATVKLPWLKLGQPCGYLAADRQAVWSATAHCPNSSNKTFVTRIDPRTNQLMRPLTGFAAPIGLGLGLGSLWVADLDWKAIYRIDPRTGRAVGKLEVGGLPVRLAVGLGSVWVRDDMGRVLRLQAVAQTA